MNKNRYYLLAIIIGVLCAAYFIYIGQKDDCPVASTNNQTSYLFPDPLHTTYNMELYLDINTRTLYGSTEIDTMNTCGKTLEELCFTAYPNAFRNKSETPAPDDAYYCGFNEGWLNIDSLKVNGNKVEYQEEGVLIRALLPAALLPDKSIKVEMVWKAKIPKLAYRYGSRAGVYMLGNFYPTLNVLSDGEWHNSYNSVFGDPFCFHVASYMVNINLPEAYNMVSTGTTISQLAEDDGRTIYWVKADKVRDFCLLVTYDYQELSREIMGRNIKCYAPSNNIDIPSQIVGQSGQILNYYSNTLGSYPYPDFKVAFVPMKGFHGMEYSGLIFLREEFLNPSYDKQKREFILAHEIAHQWCYAMVGNDQLREPWLDEGLANWLANKYLQKYRSYSQPDINYQQGVKLSKQLKEMRSNREYYSTAYEGGEAFWYGLEQELGEETVINVLRSYLAEYRYKIASGQDLLTIIEKEAHKDMDYYFNKWF